MYRLRYINQSLEKVKCWMDYLVLFPWKKLGVQFPDYVIRWYCTGKRSYRKYVTNFSTSFSVTGFMLAQSTEAFQLVSGFLTKGVGSRVVELLCSWEEREGFLCHHHHLAHASQLQFSKVLLHKNVLLIYFTVDLITSIALRNKSKGLSHLNVLATMAWASIV